MYILDKKYKVKKFLNTIFREIDFTKENIRTLQTNKKWAVGTTKNLLYRYCLSFDFDKKDLGQEKYYVIG